MRVGGITLTRAQASPTSIGSRGPSRRGIDVEVLQEILHRYRAIRRWPDGARVYDLARRIVPVVLPVTVEVLDSARALMEKREQLPARDAIHAEVAKMHGIREICSYDQDFDGVDGIDRVKP